MNTAEAWDKLEPTLSLLGVETVPGEPGGYVTLPQFPDPRTGRSLGDQVWWAIHALVEGGLSEDQLEAVRVLLDAVAKAVRYQTVPRTRFDVDQLSEMLRDWPPPTE